MLQVKIKSDPIAAIQTLAVALSKKVDAKRLSGMALKLIAVVRKLALQVLA